MQSLHENVRLAAIRLWRAVQLVLSPLAWLLRQVVGSPNWQAPGWLQWASQRLAPLGRKAQEQAAWVALAAALALGGAWGALHGPQGGWKNWWNWQTFSGAKQDASKVSATSISVSGPERTPYEGDAKPRPVVLNFSASAAPLARVGKEAAEVSLSPALAGKWTWTAVNRLEFLPDQDWPIGETYTVTLGPKALAPHVSADRTLTFRAPAFEVDFKNATFYQDPVQVTLRKAVFDVGFSHPVNPEAFEKRLRLEADGAASGVFSKSSEGLKYTVTYDKLRLNASVHSEPLPIPQVSASMALRIAPGVVAQRGGNATTQEAVKAVAIPGLFSLDIAELKQMIVTADSGEPENVLQITAGMPVHEKEMARGVSAWLLPQKNAANGNTDEVYAWSDPEEVTDAVLKQAKKVALNAVPVEREINEIHAFKLAAEPGRYLLVRIQKGLKSAGGYQLGAQRDEIIRVKRSAPELAIMNKGSLLALSGDKKLPVIVRDLPGVKLEIGRLLPQQLQHLITQAQGDMTKPEFYAGITPDNLTERFEKKLTYNHKAGKTHYETIDFSEYLKADASDRRGVFVVSVQGFDPKAGGTPEGEQEPDRQPDPDQEGYEGEGEQDPSEAVPPSQMKDRRLVIVTDLGLVSKLAVDGTRDVFVQSIANGQPVAGAAVEIWARNGSVLSAQVTDATGRARLPSMAGLVREKAPVVLVVKKAGDLSFLPLNRADRNLDLSRFDVGGVRFAGLPNQIQAYLFSDRGIYRPGDTMNIGIVAKSTNWEQRLVDLPVEVEVIDARGLTVRRDKLKLGASGMAEFSHTTQDESPTGNYTINLNLARDAGSATPGAPESPAQRLGSVSVKVQEFMPDRMKVSAKLSTEVAEGWITPKDLKTRVNVQNLFGTPAPNRRVDAALTLAPAFPAFRSHPDYSFFDPTRAKESFRADLEKGTSDDQGNAEFDLGLQRYAQATYQLHVLVKAFEPEGGRSVAAEATALVSDRPYLVGSKADGDLGYITRNGVRHVSFIAIDPNAKKKAVGDLRLARIERKVVSVLVKQPNGLFKYESRAKDSVLQEEPFSIAANGSKVMLSTQTPGNFAYAVRDANGLELAHVGYSVAGTGNVSRSLDRNTELQMTLNKKDYEPGGEIEISIRAPYAGAGLITIERDKVFAHKWFMAQDTASVQKITLPKEFEGSGYVSVQFARDLGSNEIYMSPMSYGVVPFATSLARRTNPMTLQAPELIKPGQTAKFKLESKVPSRAVLFAVDEGILQVARYQAPDPLKFFFQKRALEVSAQQTLDLILPEFKKLMQAAPGGDGEGQTGKHLNPFKRRTDKPVVFWSGVVDINGSKEFSYTVPESFNGSLRVMAVTVNDDTVSAATQQTVVRGDIVLLPNVPVAITPGDEVEIGVGVANNTKGSGKDAPLALAMSVSPGLEVIGPATQQLKVSERSEVATKFRVRAKPGAQALLGSASVILTAQVGQAKARLSTDVSVRPASAFVTLVQTGLFRGDAEIKSQADMYPNFKRSEAALSSSPWAFSTGLMQYLEVYPYGCTEQITSQIFPAVLLAAQPGVAEPLQKMNQAGAKAPDPKKSFERYLAQVRARQTADGGFAMWPGGPSDLFATTYVVNLLVEAKDRKFAVPNDMLQRANVNLQTRIAEVNNRHDYTWRVQAQAAYLLTRQGVVTTAALTNLNEGLRQLTASASNDEQRELLRRDLGAVYLAASFQMLKQEKIAQELLQPALKELLADTDPWKNWTWLYYYDPLVHQSTTVQLLARHFPAQIKTLPMDYWSRMATAIRENHYQSLSAARMLLAIDAYANLAAQSAAGKVGIRAVNAAGVAKALELPQQLALTKLAVPLDSTKLVMNNGGELPLFYGWAESGFERTLPKEAVNEGLEIIQEFLDAKGNVVTEAAVGDDLSVRVRVRSTKRSDVPQVALVNILPGGLEPVLSAPSDDDAPDLPIWRRRLGGKSSWNLEYADIREDRVVLYGSVENRLTEVTYKVRATNVGEFIVPASYAEAMYERRIFGRSAAGKFVVKSAGK
jgi:alpha-2-macroglobulin